MLKILSSTVCSEDVDWQVTDQLQWTASKSPDLPLTLPEISCPTWKSNMNMMHVCLDFTVVSDRVQGMSETFSTLHGLVNKGVKVVMDIPYELWNETSAEVADLKKQVQNFLCSFKTNKT